MDIDFLTDNKKDEGTLYKIGEAILDFFLPRTCIVCGTVLDSNERHLCTSCWSDLPQTYYWILRNNPMADHLNKLIQKELEILLDNFGATEVHIERENYAYAAALFFYRTESDYRHITQRIKYNGDLKAGVFFGRCLGEKLASGGLFGDVDVIIPVPLHWGRQWSRGYNQAEIIAEGIGSRLGVPVRCDILTRTRKTETQTRLSIEEKHANVSNAFDICRKWKACNAPGVPKFRHILLVDDVFTTGATLFACFRALRSVYPPSVRISVASLGFVGGM